MEVFQIGELLLYHFGQIYEVVKESFSRSLVGVTGIGHLELMPLTIHELVSLMSDNYIQFGRVPFR